MNDFDYEVKERKALVPSARRRKCGSRSKYCSLPSDNLTEGAKRKLNSECVTINMNKPYTYKELKKASEDVQRQYIKRLQDEYNASVRLLGPMLGISYQTVRNYLDRLGLTRPKHTGRPNAEQRAAFEKFCNSQLEEVAVEPEVERTPAKAERVVELDDDQFNMLDINFHIDGQAFAVCKKLISMIGADAYGTFNITFYPIKKGGES